jgi:hypothetical protein
MQALPVRQMQLLMESGPQAKSASVQASLADEM